MRSLKDSRGLGIAQVDFVSGFISGLETDVDITISAAVMEAFKAGADWQLRTSEKNYRQKLAKELEVLQANAMEFNKRHGK